jgi:hypothetical protein
LPTSISPTPSNCCPAGPHRTKKALEPGAGFEGF